MNACMYVRMYVRMYYRALCFRLYQRQLFLICVCVCVFMCVYAHFLINASALHVHTFIETCMHTFKTCQQVVSGSSTYSWWGAYLARDDAIVVAPRNVANRHALEDNCTGKIPECVWMLMSLHGKCLDADVFTRKVSGC